MACRGIGKQIQGGVVKHVVDQWGWLQAFMSSFWTRAMFSAVPNSLQVGMTRGAGRVE